MPETRPPALDSTSPPPPLFDGTTRLYISYTCAFAQRPWIVRNYKGLQDKIELVAIDLDNRPVWYKEKVYQEDKVPSLEHNGKIIGESLELIKYLDENFEGPPLMSNDPYKRALAEDLIPFCDTFLEIVHRSFKGADPPRVSSEVFDILEFFLEQSKDGPFFLGEFSIVDITFIPLVEKSGIYLKAIWGYDILAGRPRLSAWVEELNKIEAYVQTKPDPKQTIEMYRAWFMGGAWEHGNLSDPKAPKKWSGP